MATVQQNTKTAIALGGRLRDGVKNAPSQYGSRRKQYLGAESTEFVHEYAKYSSDFFDAQVQGLSPNAPLAWEMAQIRMADISPDSAGSNRKFDDFKSILFADKSIDYVRPGTKIVCMGSTWLAVNPQNISGAVGSAIVQRCNSAYFYLDFYGNIQVEPVCVENVRANSSDSDAQDNTLVNKGYFKISCQANDATRMLNTNSRLILSSGAYRITGFSDFEQEFTGDYSSVRMLTFEARYEPPNEEIDDMENHVAGGKTFSWEISIAGQTTASSIGQTVQYTASSKRNGETVIPSVAKPVSYLWTSSNPSVATVDTNGLVTVHGTGTTSITASLAQNQTYSGSVELTVESLPTEQDFVRFMGTVPDGIPAYGSVSLTAAYFEDGIATADTVSFSCTCENDRVYAAIASNNTVTVTNYGGGGVTLTVTATCKGKSASATLILYGV